MSPAAYADDRVRLRAGEPPHLGYVVVERTERAGGHQLVVFATQAAADLAVNDSPLIDSLLTEHDVTDCYALDLAKPAGIRELAALIDDPATDVILND